MTTKILYIFSDLHLHKYTGQAKLAVNVLNKIMENNDVYVITNSNDANFSRSYLKNQPQKEKFLILKGVGNYKTYLFNFKNIINYGKKINPDVIYSQGVSFMYLGFILSKFLKKPFVHFLNETWERDTFLTKNFKSFCLKQAVKIFVSSNYVMLILEKEGISVEKIKIIYFGLDPIFLGSYFKNNNSVNDILYYGDAKRERGFDFAADLSQILSDTSFKFLIRWVDNNSRSSLKSIENKSNVTILYYPYKKDLIEHISKSKLILLPFRFTGVRPPLSLVECMALGKCIITTKMGGNEDLITNGKTGFFLKTLNCEKEADFVNKILKDDNLRKNVGKNARNFIISKYGVNEFTKITDTFEEIRMYYKRENT